MKAGKLDTSLLKKIVFENITYHRDEVLIRPGVGEDCAVVDFGEYACVLSTDPITGAANEVGRLAVHISCNDIASNGVAPMGLMMTIMAPIGTTAEEINEVMKQAGETAAALNVEIIGGHTEITPAVNRIVVSVTALGRMKKEQLVKTSGACIGDHIILTKSAGLEGTSILAFDFENKLKEVVGEEIIQNAKKMMEQISVIEEGVIGGEVGATSMHDVTEGGVLGAVWELCEASAVGARLYMERVPIAKETDAVCRFFDIDPLKLISSGCMIMTIPKEKEKILLKRLEDKGIKASIIGEITEGGRYLVDGLHEIEILPPESDELYKVL
ncbi:MAG: AIR synthase family protein [Bacillota bacterium]